MCVAGSTDTQCGNQGVACQDCTKAQGVCEMGQTCSNAPPCGSSNCPKGCCGTDGGCQQGQSDEACGTDGELCIDCTDQGMSDMACLNGMCTQ
jgi:hypothetical protein